MRKAALVIGFACATLLPQASHTGSALAQQKADRPAADPNGAAAKAPVAPPPTAAWHDDPSSPPQQDPKALEVLKAGLKALGGEGAILGRQSIFIRRKCINREYPDPREGTITIWFKRPDRFRKEVVYPGQKLVLVFAGNKAWADDGSGPRTLGANYTASTLDGIKELDMPANYLSADLTYFNISQEIPGKLAHVVKVRQHGYTRELMFDVTSSLLEVSGEYENPWGATDKMLRFDHYRPVEGLMVPFRVEHWRANEIVLETEIEEIRFNGPIDDALFETPVNLAPAK